MLEELHSHRFVGGVGGRSRRAAEMTVFFRRRRRRGSGPLVSRRGSIYFWKPLSVGVEQDVDFSLSGQKPLSRAV